MGTGSTRAAVLTAQCASEFGLLHGDGWVALAAQLVAEGEESQEVVALACAGPELAPSELDALVADVVEAHGSDAVDRHTTVEVLLAMVAADVAARPPRIDNPMVRFGARLALSVDDAVLWECWNAAEFLDCRCHTGEEAALLEPLLRARARTDLPDELIDILATVARRYFARDLTLTSH